VQWLACFGFPNFASTIVASGDEPTLSFGVLVTVLVKGAVRQWQHMRLQGLEQFEVLFFLGLDLLNKL
jgi:hypothetical protein